MEIASPKRTILESACLSIMEVGSREMFGDFLPCVCMCVCV